MAIKLIVAALIVVVSLPAPLTAQDRPVVFVHGLNGNAHSWEGTAARLQQQLAIRAYVAQLPWRETFETQAAELQAQFGALPASTVGVGHSNGGLVTRVWSLQHPLAGLLTVGTPNTGVPAVDNLHTLLHFNQGLYNAIGMAAGAFSIDPTTWNFVYLYLQGALIFSQQIAKDTIFGLAGVGVQAWLPVTGQMSTSSYLITNLNSGYNIAREQNAIARRAGLVYVARNYSLAGPMRLIDPDNADRYFLEMWSAIYLMEGVAAALTAHYPTNATAMWIANALFTGAGWVRAVDPVWCWFVTNDYSCSTWHDGIVPIHNQALPGASNIFVGGPAHTQETKEPGPVEYALLNNLGITRRSGAPPPSGTGSGDELGAGQTLYPGQKRTSGDGRFELAFQHDGNLVLYRLTDGVPLWATGTNGAGGEAAMQADGNFVVYDSSGNARWSSGTINYPGARLFVQNDGNVVIYDFYGFAIWATGTVQ